MWYYPVWDCYGHLLLRLGEAAEAAAAFRASLAVFPRSGWALEGLAQAHTLAGDSARAQAVRSLLTAAWASADVRVHSACPQFDTAATAPVTALSALERAAGVAWRAAEEPHPRQQPSSGATFGVVVGAAIGLVVGCALLLLAKVAKRHSQRQRARAAGPAGGWCAWCQLASTEEEAEQPVRAQDSATWATMELTPAKRSASEQP